MNEGDFGIPPSLRNAIVWIVVSVALTILLGGGAGSLVMGIARGGLEASGVEIGKSLVESGKVVGARLFDLLEANRASAMYARPTDDHRSWCGVDPNQETYCCDTGRRLVIEYWGDLSPYSGHAGIKYRRLCY